MQTSLRYLTAILLLGALAACSTVPRKRVKNTTKTFTTVIVDAGHGGRDNGAVRRYGGTEKTMALDVARRLNEKLRESELQTIMTRDSDVFVSLQDRVDILNAQKNAILVSVHFNDSRKRGISGFETYYYSPVAKVVANRIQQKLLTIPRSANRGVRFGDLHVLREANYPAVLVECGFLSNRKEGGRVRDADYRELLADRIAEAIVEVRYGRNVYRASAEPAESATAATGN